MDAAEFRTRGREMVDYIADYLETISSRTPLPDVTPGYLRELLPDTAPTEGENWDAVMEDIDRVIMPGGSASESTLVALLSARTATINKLKGHNPGMTQGQIIDKLVAYISEESHSAAIRAALIGLVTLRSLPTDESGSLRGATLQAAIQEDQQKGLVPFFLNATVGTTFRCSSDNLTELGPICNENNIWMHIDAAYAGSACICPEFRYLLNGVELNATVGTTFRCSSDNLTELGPICNENNIWMHIDAAYAGSACICPEFRYLLNGVEYSNSFTFNPHKWLQGDNPTNTLLNKMINDDRRIHMTPSEVKGQYFLRFLVSNMTRLEDVRFAWMVIQEMTGKLLTS
ncbi:Aromatic-l-amino-acid decarboxylase [Plakobranchus ocellatus]|uniref:Aromatic-L-amino-acid decarboxylase n=1 Tax=Plakobranchus ocellatus TaxID=259542 RepID=A0AAV4BEL4_9GAST|nr:Aromatic-l-amino-acid decarboxylase [Plakobranchus ocellatus]